MNFGMNTECVYFYLMSNSELLMDLATGVRSLGTKEAQERILKIIQNVYEKGRGRVQAWEFDN